MYNKEETRHKQGMVEGAKIYKRIYILFLKDNKTIINLK